MVQELIRAYSGSLYRYDYLNIPTRKAIDIYFKKEYDNAVGIAKETEFMVVDIPIQTIISIIMQCDEYKQYGTFKKYHEYYMAGGDIVKHRKIWPIIISDGCDDLILDGWHRFHWYYEQGIKIIPCIALYKE